MRNKNVLSIYEYNDFRSFLCDWQREKRKLGKEFSKGALCARLGLPNSRSYFNDVLNGKKVTASYIDRFVSILGLDEHETRYFRVLVKFNQACEPSERELYFAQLIACNKTPKQVLSPVVYRYYSKWYYAVVRSVLDVVDFTDDYRTLAQVIVPRITVRQARESISLLLDLGLIVKNQQGFLKPANKAVTTPDYVKDELLRQYQGHCLESARNALALEGDAPREFFTNTISISYPGLVRLQKHVRQFRDEIRSLVNRDENPADRVYQINLQLFPHSTLGRNGKK